MTFLDPIAIAVIAKAGGPPRPTPGFDYILQERRFRESLRDIALVSGLPGWREAHAAFYQHDPYLDVGFEDAEHWCNARFSHDPLIPARTSEDLMSQAPWAYCVDWFALRQPDGLGGRLPVRPSPALLKAIQRVLWEPDDAA